MTRSLKRWFLACGVCALATTFAACSNQNPLSITSTGSPNFVGPGGQIDLWLDFGPSVMEMSIQPSVEQYVNYTSLGAFSQQTNSFLNLQVTDVDEGSAGPVNGADTYALQVPGAYFYQAPFTTPGRIIGMIPWGICPANDMPMNFIKLSQPSGWAGGAGNGDAFGVVTYTLLTGVTTINHDYNLDVVGNQSQTADQAGAGLALAGAGTCSGGVLSDYTTFDTFVDWNEGLIVHNLNTEEVYFAVPQLGTAPTLSTFTAGAYSGIMYLSAGSGTNSPFTITFSTSGSNIAGTTNILSSIFTGASDGSATNALITLGNQTLTTPDTNASEFISGTIKFGGGTNDPIVCLPAASQILCVAEDDAGKFVSLVMVAQ